MSRTLAAVALALSACGRPAPAASNISLDLAASSAANVFQLLGQITQRDFIVPACAAERTVDLRLENVPPGLVLDVLANQLGLAYHDVEGATVVSCTTGLAGIDAAVLDTRVSLQVSDTASDALLQHLAAQAGLSGAFLEAAPVSISLALTDVRLETALQAFQESAHLAEITVRGDVLVGRAVRPLSAADLDNGAITDTVRDLLDEPFDCPGERMPTDRAVVGFITDAEGRVHQSWALDIDASDALAACVEETIAGWVDPDSGPPAAYAEFPLRLTHTPPALGDAPLPAWIDDILADEDIRDAGCLDGTCTIVGVFDSNERISAAMSALDAADRGQVILTQISAASTGGKRAQIVVVLDAP